MKKNYAYYNNPKINSFKDLMNLSIKKPDDTAFSFLDKSKVQVNKTYQDFYEDVRLTSNYIANLYNNKHIALIGENSYNFLVLFMSIVISGNCVVIIDKDYISSQSFLYASSAIKKFMSTFDLNEEK